MSRIAYVNGRYVPHGDAAVHVEDRGYQFADGVYEVIAIHRGTPVDLGPHLDRLDRCLADMQIARPMTRPALVHVLRQVVRRNRVRDGIVYLQVTRGVAPRNHAFPKGVAPAVVVTARPRVGPSPKQVAEGVGIITLPEQRWARRDVKTVGLLANVLAKQKAAEAGAFEAWLVAPDGTVTEATSSNAWIVTAEGVLVTRPLSWEILPGITRMRVIDLARRAGLRVEERAFSVEEARAAREAFVTSTTAFVLPVVSIDGTPIANGHPGTVAGQLRALYMDHMRAEADAQANGWGSA